jgi:Fic-DOC domain mobile mystery protein B
MSSESPGDASPPELAPEEEGTTPLDPDEAEGLIPGLLTRGELNAWEQANIVKAEGWVFRRRRDVLTVGFAMELHRRMFDETWTWAGKFRRSDKNIGVPWPTVPVALRNLLDDARYWIEHGTYSLDESTARFHHRLVSIHPFPNGNGRHGRLMTDVLARSNGAERFTWGRGNLTMSSRARIPYLAALRQADGGTIAPLLGFMRS